MTMKKEDYMKEDNNYPIYLYNSKLANNNKQAEEYRNMFFKYTFIDDAGVVRWKSDNTVPSPIFLSFWKYTKINFNYDTSYSVGLYEQRMAEGFFANTDELKDDE